MITLHKIEFDAVGHCNLTCHGCNHVSPYFDEDFASYSTFCKDVETMKT